MTKTTFMPNRLMTQPRPTRDFARREIALSPDQRAAVLGHFAALARDLQERASAQGTHDRDKTDHYHLT